MMSNKGQAFLLKLGNGETPQTYQTVAGLRTTQLTINGDLVVNNREPSEGQWRELVSGAGTRAVSISASGIFLGSAAEQQVRSHALSGTVFDAELSFENGERLRGTFLAMRLDYAGDYNGERNYAIQLESSGPVVPA